MFLHLAPTFIFILLSFVFYYILFNFNVKEMLKVRQKHCIDMDLSVLGRNAIVTDGAGASLAGRKLVVNSKK